MTLNQEIVLTCAFRYALGRMTYVVDSVASEIERNVTILPSKDLALYQREIKEAIAKKSAGMEMDEQRWLKCHAIVLAEAKRRNLI